MHDTRRAVVEAIRQQNGATVSALSEILGISPIAVRHHLTSLQAEGLVRVVLQRQGAGRPRHIYVLTAAASENGQAYHRLADRLLDEMKAALSPEQVNHILNRLAEQLAALHNLDKLTGSVEERLHALVRILGGEGFRAAIRRADDSTFTAELRCPYVQVGQRHPEVCHIDRALMEVALGTHVRRSSCVLNGDRSCTFDVSSAS